MQRILLLCCLLTAMPAAWCRAVTLPATFDIEAFPAQITLGEVTADWFKVKTPASDSADATLMLVTVMRHYLPAPTDLTLTRGQLVGLSGRLYLVVYRPQNTTAFMEGEAQAPLTPQTLLYPSLISISDLLTLAYAGPFNLEQEIRERNKAIDERNRMIEQRAREIQERVARQEAAVIGERYGDNEAQLKAVLRQMRTAIALFRKDTGAYPAALADLVRSKENAPANGVDADGKPVPIPDGTYGGPYLPPHGGIQEVPGIPINPYVDLHADNPSPALLDTHWQYQNGYVGVPEYLFGILASDGRMLGEL